MLPVVIFAVVALPLLVVGFLVVRRKTGRVEHPSSETEADRVRTEHEFEEAEQFEQEWRERNQQHLREERLP